MRTTTWVRPLAAVAFASTLLAGAGPAWAANHSNKPGGGSSTTGIDISYPQCSATSLPTGEAFAIVGVNGGLANDYNSCLATEFAYAEQSKGTLKQAGAQLYLNTADPGNAVADWPSPAQLGAYGKTTNQTVTCDYALGTSGVGANSTGCAYIYGYDMVAGIAYSGGTIVGDLSDFNTATSGRNLYAYPVWLDVETANSWQTGSNGLAMNVADLQGMVDAVRAAAGTASAAPIGIYSTSYQWNQITGTPSGTGAGNLSGLNDWIPGARRQSAAASNCSLGSFTGGTVTITQWTSTYDYDYSCVG